MNAVLEPLQSTSSLAQPRKVDEILGAFQMASGSTPLFVHRIAGDGPDRFEGLRLSAARDVATHGLPIGILDLFQRAFGFTAQQTYELAKIDRSQASRLRSIGRRLNEAQSARVLRAMDICARAMETFGTCEAAATWLSRPHPSLGGHSPLQLGVGAFGADEVRGMLAAVRHGGVA